LLGVPYVGLAAASLVWLRFDPAVGRVNVLFVLLMVWASDIGAYLVGRLAGGPKLAPSISPGKTWSGAAGGVAASLLVAVALAGAAPWRAAIVAVVLSIVSQAGDLLESALKRHVGVKDSGRLIPGHGGLLDRLDGMLTAAPAAALLAAALGRGARLW
jgi:phosphatidate cytidylyltransferase